MKLIKFQPEKLESEVLGSPKAKVGKASMKTIPWNTNTETTGS